ncbi:hypothetical protein CKO19_14040 [Rhodovulum adriaticum]|nr:hypothetical protein [Rhodovulum adriaticum]
MAIGLSMVIVFGTKSLIGLLAPAPAPGPATPRLSPIVSLPPADAGMPRLPQAPDPTRTRGQLRVPAAPRLPADQAAAPPLPRLGPFGLPCDPDLILAPADRQGLHLTLAAPCHLNQRADITLGALRLSARTDHLGRLMLTLPSLAGPATRIAFADDTGVDLPAPTGPDALHLRAGLIAPADAGVQLHVHEGDTASGAVDHLRPGKATGTGRIHSMDLPGTGIAQLYATRATAPTARLSIEMEITPANCGRDVTAMIALPGTGDTLTAHPLNLTVPDCGAVGEFLVLKNLSPDWTLAAR